MSSSNPHICGGNGRKIFLLGPLVIEIGGEKIFLLGPLVIEIGGGKIFLHPISS
jgi:hypothetical protein